MKKFIHDALPILKVLVLPLAFGIIFLCAIFISAAHAENLIIIDSQTGRYYGNLNANRSDPNSISNPQGRYGSRYAVDGINNPYSRVGNPYAVDGPMNPYAVSQPESTESTGLFDGSSLWGE